jgi:hypothetical protein
VARAPLRGDRAPGGAAALTPVARRRALARYRSIDDALVEQTIERLRDRIDERFPASGLGRVSAELLSLAREASERAAYARRPHWPTRIGVGIAIAAMVAVVAAAVVAATRLPAEVRGLAELVQASEAALSDLVFLGATIVFLVTLEGRIKRQRVLRWLYQLRSVAHIVDMHQLTKDPERLLSPLPALPDTASSPARTLTAPELGRYLDYCSELLALTSKVAATVVQHFTDPVVLQAVNEIETLCSGLSGKVWQKITLLERATSRVDG